MASPALDLASDTLRRALATEDGIERARLIREAIALHRAGMDAEEARRRTPDQGEHPDEGGHMQGPASPAAGTSAS
jgi:hypothetical protein